MFKPDDKLPPTAVHDLSIPNLVLFGLEHHPLDPRSLTIDIKSSFF